MSTSVGLARGSIQPLAWLLPLGEHGGSDSAAGQYLEVKSVKAKSRREFLVATVGAAAIAASFAIGPAMAADPIGVGVLFPGTTKDGGWMQSGFEGLKRAEAAHPDAITVTFIENVGMSDYEQALQSLASKSKLVVSAGGQVQADTEKVAERFPDVNFVVIGGAPSEAGLPNLAVYDVRQAEVAYLAGAAAALLSESGAISFVGGMEIPPIVNAGIEFKNGATAVKPNIKVFTTLTGDFDDVAKAKEAALAAAAGGADIHYAALTLGMRGLEQAVTEQKGFIIGSYSDKCGTDDRYIAYSITGVGMMIETAVQETLDGTWKGEPFRGFGLKMGPQSSGIVVCNVSPEVAEKLKQIEADLLDGKITTLDS